MRCSKCARDAAPLRGRNRPADTSILLAGYPLDQTEIDELADLTGNSRVISTDKIAQFHHANGSAAFDLEKKPRQRCVKRNASLLKNAIVKLRLIQIGSEIGKRCCQRSEFTGSLWLTHCC